jgi:hypothetical protein
LAVRRFEDACRGGSERLRKRDGIAAEADPRHIRGHAHVLDGEADDPRDGLGVEQHEAPRDAQLRLDLVPPEQPA